MRTRRIHHTTQDTVQAHIHSMAAVLKPDILRPSVIWERTPLHPRLSRARTELSSQAITTTGHPTTSPILKLHLRRHHRETTELDLHRAVRSGVNSCYRCTRNNFDICICTASLYFPQISLRNSATFSSHCIQELM
jgi:hypothetical protein